MRVILASQRKIDPEAICTRVVSRLIEEFACVCITPSSPAWQDILQSGQQRVGQLSVYQGRGRVQRIVSAHFAVGSPALDSHHVSVFSAPSSPLPHFLLKAVHVGPRVELQLDLLPKRDLGVSLAYLDCCFAPLGEIRAEVDCDSRFSRLEISRRAQSFLSPWHLAHALDVADLSAAAEYVNHYVNHWANLLKSNASELQADPTLAERDAVHRKLLFSRDVDPSWGALDRLLGQASVDQLLAAFATT